MKRAALFATVFFAVLVVSQDRPPTGGRPHDPRPGTGRIQTATRAVTKYSGLERGLIEALQSKNANTVSNLLAEDFEVWSGEKT